MLLFIYHWLWTLGLLPLLPFLLLCRDPRLRGRLALDLPPGGGPRERTLWVHALSVGEVLSALPLVETLRSRYRGRQIVFTVTTRRGMEVARETLEGRVDRLLYMPLDFIWSMRRMVRFIRPALFLVVETDLWPGVLDLLEKQGVPRILVNGRISPKTHAAYRRLKPLSRIMLDHLSLCLLQTPLDTWRLEDLDLDPKKLITAGNIKFDRERLPLGAEEKSHWQRLLGLTGAEDLWVAGSTHAGEEAALLRVFKDLRPSYPRLRLILAPRRIERSREIERLCREMGIEAALRSTCPPGPPQGYRVFILDSLGELERLYGMCRISFVGGSLVPLGGHNLLEPASFGCPVLFGPHTFNFELMSRSLLQAGGGLRVTDPASLTPLLKALLDDPEALDVMGRKAKAFVQSNQGALARVMEHIARTL